MAREAADRWTVERRSLTPSTFPFLLCQRRGLPTVLAPRASRLRFLMRFKGLRFRRGCVPAGRAGVRIRALLCSRSNRGCCGTTYIHKANNTSGVIILFMSRSDRGVDTAAETSLTLFHHRIFLTLWKNHTCCYEY